MIGKKGKVSDINLGCLVRNPTCILQDRSSLVHLL